MDNVFRLGRDRVKNDQGSQCKRRKDRINDVQDYLKEETLNISRIESKGLPVSEHP